MESGNVVKSKSSNSGKTVKSEVNRNKKSRSNAELPHNVTKKRGVYVGGGRSSARTSRTNSLEKYQIPEKPKAPPRPRPGNKKFLASVLNILSKSTTGTQYPDTNESRKPDKTNRINRRKINFINENKEIKIKKRIEAEEPSKKVAKKKPKYKSKVLNNEVDKQTAQERCVVLHPQKEIIQTPSVYSENDSINWTNVTTVVKRVQLDKEATNRKVEELIIGRRDKSEELKKHRKDKRVRIDDPATLVAERKDSKTASEGGATDLYDFFVDLLEKTISVYSVKKEYEKLPKAPSVSSPPVPLEINESVAKKLQVAQEKPKVEAVQESIEPSNNFYCLKDLEFINALPNPKLYETQKINDSSKMYDTPKIPKQRKINESFSFIKKPVVQKLKAESVIETRPLRSYSRKERKRNLINLFKEQLAMDYETYEEPQSLYQALKVMAHKKRSQRTTMFREALRRRKLESSPQDCVFKSRKVISPKGSNNCRKRRMERDERKYKNSSDIEGSRHSLEVTGYDYQYPTVKKTVRPHNDIRFSMSTLSFSEQSFGSKEFIVFSDADSKYYF